MKIKIIKERDIYFCGEVVTIVKGTELKAIKGMEADSRDVLNTPEGMCYLCEYENKMVYIPAVHCIIIDAIDWEQRRYEIAKELMKGFISNPDERCIDSSFEALATWSVECADILIGKLKEEQQ